MLNLIEQLFPICRSITGNGFRQSLAILSQYLPLRIHEVPSGTPVFDWLVPKEWNVREAYIANRAGERVVDFAHSNLHLLQYSHAIDRIVSLDTLQRHLYSLPETPQWIPYRTAYYADTWGFCVTQEQRNSLTDSHYHVVIDTTLKDGHLTYGELILSGTRDDEVLISCHSCHPSLANDNLSGIAVATMLAQYLSTLQRRYTYRFLFIPGLIGSLTWLARNENVVPRIKHGLVLSCLGDSGQSTYKQSRLGNATIDRYAEHVLRHSKAPYRIAPFTPYGYDERQYCSPGFDMPVGALMRSPNGTYRQYHTSADNLDLIDPGCLADSLVKLKSIVEIIEEEATYRSLNPKGEPQLGRRGLYKKISGQNNADDEEQMALLWLLSFGDGRHSLFDIAERSGLAFGTIRAAANKLIEKNLLASVNSSSV